jgi:GntR family phosphonate transport system transcriptional regulator
MLERGTGESLYRQISRTLRQEIGRKYEAGQFLPPERELAERFAVNRHTIRHAVDELVKSCLVERQHGRGMMVVGRPVDYGLSHDTRFTQNIEAQGLAAGVRLLRKHTDEADGEVAKRLKIRSGEPVIWIETLRLVEDKPFCVTWHFIPEERSNGRLEDYEGGSLHHFLRQHYGIRLKRTYSLITALLPQADDANVLCMSHYQPVLRVKSVNVDISDGKPFEYAVTRFRADCVELTLDFGPDDDVPIPS